MRLVQPACGPGAEARPAVSAASRRMRGLSGVALAIARPVPYPQGHPPAEAASGQPFRDTDQCRPRLGLAPKHPCAHAPMRRKAAIVQPPGNRAAASAPGPWRMMKSFRSNGPLRWRNSRSGPSVRASMEARGGTIGGRDRLCAARRDAQSRLPPDRKCRRHRTDPFSEGSTPTSSRSNWGGLPASTARRQPVVPSLPDKAIDRPAQAGINAGRASSLRAKGRSSGDITAQAGAGDDRPCRSSVSGCQRRCRRASSA